MQNTSIVLMIPPPKIVKGEISERVCLSQLFQFAPDINNLFLLEYRSGIYTHTDEQLAIAEQVTAQIQKDRFDPKGKKITTEIQPAGTWYDAEVRNNHLQGE